MVGAEAIHIQVLRFEAGDAERQERGGQENDYGCDECFQCFHVSARCLATMGSSDATPAATGREGFSFR